MGQDMYGWIERRYNPGEWEGIMNVTPLLTRHYVLYSYFFSLYDDDIWIHDPMKPERKSLIPARGMPEDISEEVQQYRECRDVGWGHTWADIRELKDVDLDSIPLPQDYYNFIPLGWRIVWELMRRLAEFFHEEDEEVRLVVWFSN